jgi:hypothetical protein
LRNKITGVRKNQRELITLSKRKNDSRMRFCRMIRNNKSKGRRDGEKSGEQAIVAGSAGRGDQESKNEMDVRPGCHPCHPAFDITCAKGVDSLPPWSSFASLQSNNLQ